MPSERDVCCRKCKRSFEELDEAGIGIGWDFDGRAECEECGPGLHEGVRIEIRGRITEEGGRVDYGPWFPATVANQGRVDESTRTTSFLVYTDDDRLMFRRYDDEGKTWQLIPEVRRG